MKPEKQRIGIAEACGWKWHAPDGGISKYWHDPSGKIKPDDVIPDFLNDLNAMREAENVLNEDAFRNYVHKLSIMANGEPCDGEFGTYAIGKMWKLTAAQRAEAFLRTINKWEDE